MLNCDAAFQHYFLHARQGQIVEYDDILQTIKMETKIT